MSLQANQENLSPHIVREVYKQLKSLTSEPIEGVQIHVKEEDVSEIHATIEGPQGTPYAGGVFKMKLCLTKDFPAQPPRGFFITKIFHPNVSNNGDICVNVLKKDWHAKLGIRNVLLTIKCLLIHPNPESALNEEAGRLLLEQYQNFANRAKLMTEIHAKSTTKSTLTNHNMNEEQPSTSKSTESAMDLKKEKLLAEKKRKEKRRGLKRL